MQQLNQKEFLDIATGKTDGFVILSTTTCVKCAALKRKIEELGNPLNISTYLFSPTDEEALAYIQSNGLMSVPVTIYTKNGEPQHTFEVSYDDILEEFGL
jgi:glutaredoxin